MAYQRDMKERGHSLESIKASIESRKPDFDAYIGNFLTFFRRFGNSQSQLNIIQSFIFTSLIMCLVLCKMFQWKMISPFSIIYCCFVR